MNNNSNIDKQNEWGMCLIPFILICCTFLVYGVSSTINYVILIVFICGCIYLSKRNALSLLCFPLYFFDYVLILPNGGSFNRIYEMIFIILCFYKNNWKFKFPSRNAWIYPVYFFMSFYYSPSLTSIISAGLNVLTLMIIFSQLDNENNRELTLFL